METTFQGTIGRLRSIREYSARLLDSKDSDFPCPYDIRTLDSVIGNLEALEHRSLWKRILGAPKKFRVPDSRRRMKSFLLVPKVFHVEGNDILSRLHLSRYNKAIDKEGGDLSNRNQRTIFVGTFGA